MWRLRCTVGYHNIIRKGFALMHGAAGVSEIKRSTDVPDDAMTAAEFFQSSILPGSSRDIHIRSMRIKALKTYQWLMRPETLFELLMTCLSVQPLEKVMWTFLKWQSSGSLLDESFVPIAKMASSTSPPREAVGRIIRLMTSNVFSDTADMPDVMTLARCLVFSI